MGREAETRVHEALSRAGASFHDSYISPVTNTASQYAPKLDFASFSTAASTRSPPGDGSFDRTQGPFNKFPPVLHQGIETSPAFGSPSYSNAAYSPAMSTPQGGVP